MKSIDMLLLAGIVTTVVGLIIFPKRMNGILKSLIALTVLLALVQLFMEGYYWQYVPGYLLISVMVMLTFFLKENMGKLKTRLLRFTLLFLLLASIAPWAIFLPIPALLTPQGNYPVGTRIFRWVDVDRWEQITSDPQDRRNVTDAPFLLAPPTHFLAGAVLGFGHIPTKTHRATIDLLNAFFQGVLNDKPVDLDSVANRYRGIIRKPTD